MIIQRRFYSPDENGGASGGGNGSGGAGTGGENDDDGGAGGDDDSSDDDKPVNRADHRRAVDDMMRWKRKAADNERALADVQRKLQEIERKGKGEDIEDLKRQLEEATSKNERLQSNVITVEKKRAIVPALTEAGLRADAKKILDHLDLDDLEVEISTHGNVNVHGIEAFVKKVKREYPFAFETKKAKKVDAGGSGGDGGGGGEDWTPAKLVQLETKCKAKGDMEPYRKAVAEYLEQKKKAKEK